MITIEMITAALYSFLGLAALVVVVTQIFKDWASKSSWYQKPKAEGKSGLTTFFHSSLHCFALVLY